MKKIRFLPIFLLLCLLFTSLAPGALALDDPEISAPSAILGDPSTGRVYFSKAADERMYPASLTKIMTLLVAVEAVESNEAGLADAVTASEGAMHDMIPEGSSAGIVPGETMSLEDLLYCAALSSANEACNIIAEYIGGSIDGFVERMNRRAEELGCAGTHFTNPHGLHNEAHYTTARDVFVILSEAMDHDLCAQLLGTVTHTVPATNVAEARELSNTNGLINAESALYPGYLYEYATGGKTGHTSAAGYCLASTAERDGVRVLAVVMGCEARQASDGSYTYGHFADTIALYNWIFDNFSVQEILSSAEIITSVPVEMAADGAGAALRPRDVISALLPNDADLTRFARSYTIYAEESGVALEAPVAAGTVLGEVTVSLDGVTYGSSPLVAATSVELSKLEYLRHQLNDALDLFWVKLIFWVLVVCLVVYLLLVVRYRVLHKRHLRDVQRAREAREQRMAQAEDTRVFTESPRPRGAAPAPPATPPGPLPTPPATPAAPASAPVPEARETATVAAGAAQDDQARRDYFEEFFRNGPGQRGDKKD